MLDERDIESVFAPIRNGGSDVRRGVVTGVAPFSFSFTFFFRRRFCASDNFLPIFIFSEITVCNGRTNVIDSSISFLVTVTLFFFSGNGCFPFSVSHGCTRMSATVARFFGFFSNAWHRKSRNNGLACMLAAAATTGFAFGFAPAKYDRSEISEVQAGVVVAVVGPEAGGGAEAGVGIGAADDAAEETAAVMSVGSGGSSGKDNFLWTTESNTSFIVFPRNGKHLKMKKYSVIPRAQQSTGRPAYVFVPDTTSGAKKRGVP